MATRELSKKDFASDQEVRWCPGCGDYAILATVQGFLPEMGIPPERIVFVTGIGCAGRFVYYMNTLRHPLDPRARAVHRDRHRVDAARPGRVDRHRRRRRALDRRQPPDPRAAPQREREDPAVQQPDLRADEGPGLADVGGGQGHEVDAVRLARPPVQPGRAGARRRGDVRRADDRLRPAALRERAAAGRGAQGHGVHRGLPELRRVQRRRVRGAHRQGDAGPQPDPPGAGPADPVRRQRREVHLHHRRRHARHRRHGVRAAGAHLRAQAAPREARPASSRWRTCRTGRRRRPASGSSATSSAPSTAR